MDDNGLHKSNNKQQLATKEQAHSDKGRWWLNALPPHIAWPLFVVGLLVLGVTWSLWVVFASQSDGGAQVIENYYEKAIDWDSRRALKQQSDELGWIVNLSFVEDAPGSGRMGLAVQFEDSQGVPLTDLQGTIKAYRPESTRPITEMVLTTIPDRPGHYLQVFPGAKAGLWDFEIAVQRDSFDFIRVIRKELDY